MPSAKAHSLIQTTKSSDHLDNLYHLYISLLALVFNFLYRLMHPSFIFNHPPIRPILAERAVLSVLPCRIHVRLTP
jgi:hypothetical protein